MMAYHIEQSAKHDGNGWWSWSVWIEASDDELARVSVVEYHLHETFPEPIVRIKSADTKFRLSTGGWGTFALRARVLDDNGDEMAVLKHPLRFEYTLDASSGTTTQGTFPPYLFLSYSVTDRDIADQVKARLSEYGIAYQSADEIPAGVAWQSWIQETIAGAKASVAIVSGEPSRFVEFELQKARDLGKPVFAVLGQAPQVAVGVVDDRQVGLSAIQSIDVKAFLDEPTKVIDAMRMILREDS